MDFYESLRENRHLLNEIEDAVLEDLLKQSDHIKEVTIRQMAEANYIAPNTIVRMCKKLGFKGFSDFKASYYHALKEREHFVKMTSLDEQIIKTKQLLNKGTLKGLVERIHDADKIVLFAVGLSRFPAEEMNERLKIMGKDSQTFVDPHVMKHNAKLLSEKDLAIAISVSGTTETILSATMNAQISGAETVSITGFSANPLADITKYQLYGYMSEIKVNGIDATDRFSIHYLLNVLFSEYLMKYFDSPVS